MKKILLFILFLHVYMLICINSYAQQFSSDANLQLDDATTIQNIAISPLTHFGEGVCYAVAQQGSYAYFGNGSVLEIVNISDPDDPVIEGRYHSPSVIRGIMVSGDQLYVADFLSGLLIIDISDPSNPIEIGAYNTPGYAMDVTINYEKTHALVTDGPGGIRVINIENPEAMFETGSLETNAWAISVDDSGDNVLVACDLDGVLQVSFADPNNPMILEQYNTFDRAWDVKAQGLYIYVADRAGGLRIIDPIANEEIGALAGFGMACQIALAGSAHHYAYVANMNHGLWVIDIFNPETPETVAFYDTPQARSISLSGKHACLGDYHTGMHIFDISEPENPNWITVMPAWGKLTNIRYMDQLIYTDLYKNMAAFNADNLQHPVVSGFWNGSSGAYDIEVSQDYHGKRAYVANLDDGFWMADIDNAGSISSLGSYNPEPNRAFGVALNLDPFEVVYMATGLSVQALDISNPSSIQVIDEIWLNGLIEDVIVHPDNPRYFYVAGQGQGFYACYLNSQSELEEHAHVDSEAQVINLDIEGDYLYAADCGSGVRIFDISSPGSPIEIAAYQTGDCVYDISAEGDYLYIANSYSGIEVLNISDPKNPQTVTKYITGGYAMDVEAFHDTVFVADGENGFHVFKLMEVEDNDLDGIADYLEQGPNGDNPEFDGNDDGVPDWQQSAAASLPSHNGAYYLTLASEDGETPLEEVVALAVPEDFPDDFEFPLGIIKFKTATGTGNSTVISLIIHAGLTPDSYFNFILPAKDEKAGWYEFLFDGTTGAVIDGNKVLLYFKDGNRGDLDEIANGTIETIGGAAKNVQGMHDQEAEIILCSSYPNPFNHSLTIEYKLKQSEIVTITFYSQFGKQIDIIEKRQLKGLNKVVWTPENLADGIYYFSLEAGEQIATGKVVLIK